MPKSLPKELTNRLETILRDRYTSVLDVFSQTRKGSLRINTLHGDGAEVFEEFDKKGIIITPFVKGGGGDLHPEKNPQSLRDSSFTKELWYGFDRVHEYAMKGTRAFYEGKIYLQSIASMLPVLVLAPEPNEDILDVCAAPGSKTTQISAIMGNTGRITAIEQNQIRYDKLMHNTRLQGATNIEGVKIDARVFLGNTEDRGQKTEDRLKQYDRILLDAPCSAEGRISLDNEKSFGFWSIANIRNKSGLQYELLELAFAKLRTGGTLVYSTCTLAPEENEGVISHFLREHRDATLEDIDIGLSDKPWWTSGISEFGGEKYSSEIGKTVRILPSDETEGFYLAKIRKSL